VLTPCQDILETLNEITKLEEFGVLLLLSDNVLSHKAGTTFFWYGWLDCVVILPQWKICM
jgi:hypothetical protein